MTVSTLDRRREYPGNGTATVFPAPRIFSTDDLEVFVVNDTTGAVTTLARPADYDAAGIGLSQSTLTTTVAPAAGTTLVILRTLAAVQPTRFDNQGAFFAELHERAFDRATMLQQQFDDRLDRTLRLSDTALLPAGFSATLPAPSALGVLSWNAGGTGLVNIPASALSGEYVDIVGLVSDGVTDNAPAVRLAIDKAIAEGKDGIRYPAGNFSHASKIVMTTPVAIIGAGLGQTTLRAPFNGPLFEFDNPAKAAMKLWGGFRFIGAGSPTVNTASCCFYFPPTSIGITHCTFRDITTNSAHAFMISDATPADNGAAIAMRFSGQINWCTFDNISFRINVKYGFLWNQGSGTGNAWQGGKPAIDVSGGAFIEINGPAAPENLNLGVNVGDIIINNVHALTEGAADRTTCAFFRGGPNTNYRSRILLNGCQFDARADYPLDLSSTGSLDWSNVVVNGNVLGGEADVASKIPPLARSSVTDQGVSEWKSQYNASNSSTTLVSQQAFLITLGVDTGCHFRVVVSGGWPGYGSGVGSWEFIARRGSAGPTIYAGPSNIGAHVDIGLNVTAVVSGNDILVSVANKTASGSASWDAQLVATGGKLKVQNKRHF